MQCVCTKWVKALNVCLLYNSEEVRRDRMNNSFRVLRRAFVPGAILCRSLGRSGQPDNGVRFFG